MIKLQHDCKSIFTATVLSYS